MSIQISPLSACEEQFCYQLWQKSSGVSAAAALRVGKFLSGDDTALLGLNPKQERIISRLAKVYRIRKIA